MVTRKLASELFNPLPSEQDFVLVTHICCRTSGEKSFNNMKTHRELSDSDDFWDLKGESVCQGFTLSFL